MTVRIQPSGLADRILALLGKRRAVFLPPMEAPFGYYIARREGFFRALRRPRGAPPPTGWVYWNELEEAPAEHSKAS
jgi:hypothetical protein